MEREAQKPDWWRDNERLREEMDLPAYQPPRFSDGVYVYGIINQLEQKYEIDILLLGRNTRHGDDWEIAVDGNKVEPISYRRDKNSNTVYEISSKRFIKTIECNM